MTIIVPPDVENSINAAVRGGHFASVDDAMTEAARLLLQQLEQRQASAPPPAVATTRPAAHKPIWEVAEELSKSIPPEEWAKLPVDGATQHDHYIYGTPKRPVAQ
jgi:Arc/MetJ-type ribon-helix-helix transcriptional regulator